MYILDYTQLYKTYNGLSVTMTFASINNTTIHSCLLQTHIYINLAARYLQESYVPLNIDQQHLQVETGVSVEKHQSSYP